MAEIAMQFLLDNNVPDSVARFLRAQGYQVIWVRDILLPDSPDPIIATICEENGWILISNDHDFRKIAPNIPQGSRERFRKLSRISLECTEYQSASRLEKCMTMIRAAYADARAEKVPLRVTVQTSGIKLNR